MDRDLIIRIWMVVYDGDANRIYSFTEFDKAVAAIEGSIWSYLSNDDINDDEIGVVCEAVTGRLKELKDAPCVPMRFHNLQAVMYNWELDNANPIHKVLSACYDSIDDNELKGRIESLFSGSIH